jgi:hypothetical protein
MTRRGEPRLGRQAGPSPDGARPLIAPAQAVNAVLGSAVLWSAGFGRYAVRYWPVLTRERLGGSPG